MSRATDKQFEHGVMLLSEVERLRRINAELAEALKEQIQAFDGDTFDEIEEEYGLGTAQRVFSARAALTSSGDHP